MKMSVFFPLFSPAEFLHWYMQPVCVSLLCNPGERAGMMSWLWSSLSGLHRPPESLHEPHSVSVMNSLSLSLGLSLCLCSRNVAFSPFTLILSFTSSLFSSSPFVFFSFLLSKPSFLFSLASALWYYFLSSLVCFISFCFFACILLHFLSPFFLKNIMCGWMV